MELIAYSWAGACFFACFAATICACVYTYDVYWNHKHSEMNELNKHPDNEDNE